MAVLSRSVSVRDLRGEGQLSQIRVYSRGSALGWELSSGQPLWGDDGPESSTAPPQVGFEPIITEVLQRGE